MKGTLFSTPRLSRDAYSVDDDGRRYSLQRWAAGFPSEFIDPIQKFVGSHHREVVLLCRESTESQRPNLAVSEADARQKLTALGFSVQKVFADVEKSGLNLEERPVLLAALEYAGERNLILVAPERDRLFRSRLYKRTNRTEGPTVGECRLLRRWAGGVILATILHPDSRGRGTQSKKGQLAKDAHPGRPRKEVRGAGWALRRKAALIGKVRTLRAEGLTFRAIATVLNASKNGWPKVCFATVRNWLKL